MANFLILSVDLDEWYHGRWATGSAKSRWKNLQECFRDYYHSEKPAGEIIRPTRWLLDLFKKEGIKATFFVLGEVGEWYPDLIREIASQGHEIACHAMHHKQYSSSREFEKDLIKAKRILEELIQKPVVGFRAPNLIVPEWLPKILIKNEFLYDSSICPSRKIFGKYQGQVNLPQNPYLIADNLVEIPIPVFPFLKLPGAVSIASRVLGWPWTKITLDNALRKGSASYYIHPYELNTSPELENMTFYEKIFWRRTGSFMENIIKKLLKKYQGRIISGRDYVEKYFRNGT